MFTIWFRRFLIRALVIFNSSQFAVELINSYNLVSIAKLVYFFVYSYEYENLNLLEARTLYKKLCSHKKFHRAIVCIRDFHIRNLIVKNK